MASRQRLVASASSGDGLGMEASPSDCKKPGSSSGDSSMRARLMRASWNRSNGPVSIPWSLRRFSSFLISSSYSFVPGLGRSSFFSQSGRRKPTCMCGRLVQYQSLCTVSTATHPPGSVVSPDGGANGAPGPAPASSNGSGMHSNIGSASGLSRSSASSTQSSMSSGSTSSSSPSAVELVGLGQQGVPILVAADLVLLLLLLAFADVLRDELRLFSWLLLREP